MPEDHAAVDLERLVRQCQKGDADSWAGLIRRFQSLVYSVPKRMGLSEDDASDVFANTFAALYRSLDRIDSPLSLPKWLATTATRESYRILRARRAHISLDEEAGLDERLAAEESSAESQVADALEADLARNTILNLGTRCRELLSMLFLGSGSSYQEISANLGIPIGSIGPTKARCLDKLRALLLKTGFFDSMYHSEDSRTPTGQS